MKTVLLVFPGLSKVQNKVLCPGQTRPVGPLGGWVMLGNHLTSGSLTFLSNEMELKKPSGLAPGLSVR